MNVIRNLKFEPLILLILLKTSILTVVEDNGTNKHLGNAKTGHHISKSCHLYQAYSRCINSTKEFIKHHHLFHVCTFILYLNSYLLRVDKLWVKERIKPDDFHITVLHGFFVSLSSTCKLKTHHTALVTRLKQINVNQSVHDKFHEGV